MSRKPAPPAKGKKPAGPTPEEEAALLLAQQQDRDRFIHSLLQSSVVAAQAIITQHLAQHCAEQKLAALLLDSAIRSLETYALTPDAGEPGFHVPRAEAAAPSEAPAPEPVLQLEVDRPAEEHFVIVYEAAGDSESKVLSLGGPPAPAAPAPPPQDHVPVPRTIGPGLDPSAPGHSWTIGPEPPSCDIDRWARGVIPVKKRTKAAPDPAALLSLPASLRVDRRVSTRGSVTSAAPSSPSLRRGSTLSVNSPSHGQARPPSADPFNFDAVSVGSRVSRDFTRAATITSKAVEPPAPPKPVPIPSPPPTAEEELVDRLRNRELQRIEREKAQQALAAQMAAEAKEQADRQVRMREELKGREYTVDERGQVMLIQPVKTSKMPNVSLAATFSVVDPSAVKVATPKGRGRKQVSVAPRESDGNTAPATEPASDDKGARKAKGKRIPAADAEPVPLDHAFQQPNLAESIKPVSGVTVRDGVSGAVKMAQAPRAAPSSPKEMSRTQYLALLDSKMGPPGKPLTRPPATAPAPNRRVVSVPAQPSPMHADPAEALEQRIPQETEAAPTGVVRVASLPRAPAAAPKPRAPPPQTAPANKASDTLSSEEFNNNLLSDPSWGLNRSTDRTSPQAPRLPEKDLIPVAAQSLPRRVRNPKEKVIGARADIIPSPAYKEDPLSASVLIASKKHLPPPTYPSVTGHGMDSHSPSSCVTPTSLGTGTLPLVHNARSPTALSSLSSTHMRKAFGVQDLSTIHTTEKARELLESL